MKQRTHIPALTRDQLELALQKIDLLAIPEAAKRQLRSMLLTASNPDNEKIETIIKTLPQERQNDIYRIFAEVQAMQLSNADEGGKAVLLLGLLSLGTLIIAYLLSDDQVAMQTAQLLEQMKRAWVRGIQDEITYCGCNGTARNPAGQDYEYLKSLAERDAKSIVATYNREAENRLKKLYKEFPNGSKQFFIESMKEWTAKRSVWKSLSIALNTETQAREYARSRFAEMNYAETTKFIFTGPTPTCEDCVRRFAAGVVDFTYKNAYPCPRHPNCPHRWRALRKPKVDCSRLWLG